MTMPAMRAQERLWSNPMPVTRAGSESISRNVERAAPVSPRIGTAVAASGPAVASTSQVAPPKINIIAAAIRRPKAPSTTLSAPTTLTWVSILFGALLRERLRFLRQEVSEVGGALDVHEAAHTKMTDTEQLRTGALILAGLVRHEPHRDLHPWDGILLHPHLEQAEAVNDVETGELDEDGTINRQIELVGGDDVVLRIGLGANQAERVVGRDPGNFAPPEAAV